MGNDENKHEVVLVISIYDEHEIKPRCAFCGEKFRSKRTDKKTVVGLVDYGKFKAFCCTSCCQVEFICDELKE